MRSFILAVFCLFVFVAASGIPIEVSGQLIISEFRLRGLNGANDEYIEVYNNSGSDHTVAGGGSGYAISSSDSLNLCVIPNGTVIPDRGHWLCVNSVGYSLSAYPAGAGSTAVGNGTFAFDVPDNTGIALFRTSNLLNHNPTTRMDAVGPTSETNTLYKEGSGIPPISASSTQYAFVRDSCGKGGSITTFFRCPLEGPKDTNDNAADFIFVDTSGTSLGAGQRLGAPGPENLSSPVASLTSQPNFAIRALDPCGSQYVSPNVVYDQTADLPDFPFGHLEFRFRLTNLSGSSATKVRLRIVDISTFPAPSGVAQMMARTSTASIVAIDDAPCGGGASSVSVNATTLEQPPTQPNGGGFNSSLNVGNITSATPLANGASIPLKVRFGLQQTGTFKIGLMVESVPSGGTTFYAEGSVNSEGVFAFPTSTPFDFLGGDRKSDLSIYRPSLGEWWVRNSQNGAVGAITFGSGSDVIVPADFNSLSFSTNRAFFRPSTGTWFVLTGSSFYAVPFGNSTDIPAPGDFDGDNIADLAVFRPSQGLWFIQLSSGSVRIVGWGSPGDKPVVADYDGDGRDDIAIFRPIPGEWWIQLSNGGVRALAFGSPNDKAVVGDYTGDQRADIAFWRPSTGTWFVLRSEDLSYYAVPFGIATDLPVPGDYDGDRKSDFAVFRPSTATWYISNSNGTPATIAQFGTSGDVPVPNAYVR